MQHEKETLDAQVQSLTNQLNEALNDDSLSVAQVYEKIIEAYKMYTEGDKAQALATVMGLVAKEEVVGTFGTLYAVSGDALELVEEGAFGDLGNIAQHFTQLTAYSFLIFNLLCAPCFAAIGAIKREMNNAKWTWGAIGYQCVFAYAIALIVYQLVGLATGQVAFGVGTVAAVIVLVIILYLLFRKGYQEKNVNQLSSVDAAARN